MKAVVFAYHDMGCAGIQSLLDAGYDIAAIFTHPDNPGENHFLAPWRVLPLSKASRYGRRKMRIIRCGSNVFVRLNRTCCSRSTTATCCAMTF